MGGVNGLRTIPIWSVKPVNIEDFDYYLPEQLIAQNPPEHRTDARLLCVGSCDVEHKKISDIKELLRPGDLLVLNDTQVLKARLHARKITGGSAEVLVERVLDEHTALCQVRVSKAIKLGGILQLECGHGADHELSNVGREGQFYRLSFSSPVLETLAACGEMPLPPYIERGPEDLDEHRYQTVFAKNPGAVAAPTAGLHFSKALLGALRAYGVEVAYVTLHVGAGTFQPVRGSLDDHVMHHELFDVTQAAASQINQAKASGRRVVAVGTTVVRTLESIAQRNGGVVKPMSGETALFIQPGFEFSVIDCLVTNFHLPKSTLLMLVSAFAGYARLQAAYRQAIEAQYRFFSYGDACWLERDV
ncbi:MAG: S-adenosylmethionine:tRNA ribosyltransferase-isomerase [Limisphaerales bacterium]